MDQYRVFCIGVLLVFFIFSARAQKIADDCFISPSVPGIQVKTEDLITLNGDVLEWNGSEWEGQWPLAGVKITPPMPEFCDKPVRAVWLGSGTAWQSNGEGVSFRLDKPLTAGEAYTFHFLYVSEGAGSDANFAPELSTSLYGGPLGYTVGRLRPAGRIWHYDSISFTAHPRQNGDSWITLHTRTGGSSGLILALCPQKKFTIQGESHPCHGDEVELKSDRQLANYRWSGGEEAPAIVTTQNISWLESVSPCGTYRDTFELEYTSCEKSVGVGAKAGPPSGGIKLPKIKLPRISLGGCWFGSCGDEDVPQGPPSPDIIVYNVVTPDNNGMNDVFYIQDIELGNWRVRVFNRWGELIMESSEYKNDWSPAEYPDGTYYFIIKDINSDKVIKGVLTVVR
jgi:gliding motility-associated-like protein